jgi:hypothetical protein
MLVSKFPGGRWELRGQLLVAAKVAELTNLLDPPLLRQVESSLRLWAAL